MASKETWFGSRTKHRTPSGPRPAPKRSPRVVPAGDHERSEVYVRLIDIEGDPAYAFLLKP